MIEKIIQFSLKQRLLIVILSAILFGLGIWAANTLPIDAVPDVTNVQVQINTSVPSLAPVEVEKLVTYPVETALFGLPGVERIRSLSRYGLSQVTVVFKDNVDIYFARQLVLERVQAAKEEIPKDLGNPTLGPIATGLGEIFLYTVEGEKYDPMELRTIQDWIIKPQLKTIPGVTEINSIGGDTRQYQVLPSPNKLLSYGISVRELFEALVQNNANAGGSYIQHNEEQYLIRGVGLVQSLQDIENIVVTNKGGIPIYVRDVAEVKIAPELRSGAATRDGKETVLGTVLMLKGENSRVVSTRVREKLKEIEKTLPQGTHIKPVYDRTLLVNKTIETVKKNLFEGGILVVAVLLIFLGNLRAGLIIASAIPLSMLFAMTGMVLTKTSGNLMSLGAIDFGLIVDGAVVLVENIIRRLSHRKKSQEVPVTSMQYIEEISAAARESARPVVFAVSIITIVYLPILTLQGIEGKMFRPMAMTVVMALVGSLFFTLTLIPVLCSFFLGRHVEEKDNKVLKWFMDIYRPVLVWAMEHRKKVVLLAIGVFVVSLLVFPLLGSEFIPRLDEESLSMQTIKPTSISLPESVKLTEIMEKRILSFPQVETIFSRTGAAEIATDPEGVNGTDTFIMLKGKVEDKEELVEKMAGSISLIPGMAFGFSQPIEQRVNELIAGVRSDIAIKLYGDDITQLKEKAEQIQRILTSVSGAKEVRVEQVSGLPVLQVEIDRSKIARYGLNTSDIWNVIKVAIGGESAGQVYEGVKHFDLVVRYPTKYRDNPKAIENLLVKTPAGESIPLVQLTKKISVQEGPAQISHEQGRRRIVIETNVRGRDIGSFVDEAKVLIDKRVKLPSGYSLEWGGQFENLEKARTRLLIVVPIALFLIFILLFGSFNSIRQALLVFSGIPLSMTGGIFALFICRIHFSISAGIGFIALFGVAMLNGIIMVSYFNQLRQEGMSLHEAIIKGAEVKLRPILMTVLVASLGFVPMAIAQGTGAEVQRPLATVVIGGLISSTILTLVVLPVLYMWVEKTRRKRV